MSMHRDLYSNNFKKNLQKLNLIVVLNILSGKSCSNKKMATPVAENYQLKWHSHLTNLNTSVATLYR